MRSSIVLPLSDFAYGVLPDQEWRTLPSGVMVRYDADGPLLQLAWRLVGRSALLEVPNGLRSWSVLLRGHDGEPRVQANGLRTRLSAYLLQHTVPFSRTVKARIALAQRVLAELGPSAPVQSDDPICNPPGHTCPTIDNTQSIFRRIAWRARKPEGEDDLAAIRTLAREGQALLEEVRAENARMRAAYWSMRNREKEKSDV